MSKYIDKGAILSPCGKYRYRLWREWRLHPEPALWDMWTDEEGKPVLDGAGDQIGEPWTCVFVMLNPSTADAEDDDPTIRRCVSFAKSWGYDRMEVLNLFAYRATDPSTLLSLGHNDDPVGDQNLYYVQRTLERARTVVCAWGAHGGHLGQDQTMLGWIEASARVPLALRLTKDGHPSHPLYLPSGLVPQAFTGIRS